ncbi:hypothetical protein [Rhizobacter sp. OV335]|jgi:hypothetical protein|uniref:hypothetical protein n=1 Tax=Rhizobacter sp. OV335 TaxID=1500264 RepID=UPI0009166BC1|nr:hypothetical protein [Rhizobacter sp. OV335]SHM43247.1 hypothetical protein SAMN02787076_01316 [Rhizobacter sp. OV335]
MSENPSAVRTPIVRVVGFRDIDNKLKASATPEVLYMADYGAGPLTIVFSLVTQNMEFDNPPVIFNTLSGNPFGTPMIDPQDPSRCLVSNLNNNGEAYSYTVFIKQTGLNGPTDKASFDPVIQNDNT